MLLYVVHLSFFKLINEFLTYLTLNVINVDLKNSFASVLRKTLQKFIGNFTIRITKLL